MLIIRIFVDEGLYCEKDWLHFAIYKWCTWHQDFKSKTLFWIANLKEISIPQSSYLEKLFQDCSFEHSNSKVTPVDSSPMLWFDNLIGTNFLKVFQITNTIGSL